MNVTGANHFDLDELLFAKFAELDQKVAMLKEEMDSIAMLLERRKRTRDKSISLDSQIIQEVDHLPKWTHHDIWQAIAPQHRIDDNYTSALAFALEADRKASGQLYDADLPAEYDQPIGTSGRVANVASQHATFHPYSRPSNGRRSMSSLNSTMEIPMPAMLMPDFQGMMENELLLDQYDSGEDPPSDPDDNIGAAGNE